MYFYTTYHQNINIDNINIEKIKRKQIESLRSRLEAVNKKVIMKIIQVLAYEVCTSLRTTSLARNAK